jgi:molybdopterin synthase sulfur carrier subunit
MTTVRIPPTLRGEAGNQRQVDVQGGTVGELLDNLTSQYPGLKTQIYENGDIAPFVNVYLDSEDVRTLDGLETPVQPGAKLILLPAMAGGY